MPRSGHINPTNPNGEILGTVFAGMYDDPLAEGVNVGVPVTLSFLLDRDGAVHGIANPLDSKCIVSAALTVITAVASLTINVGTATAIDTTSDTLIDGGLLSAITTLSSADDGGTNGSAFHTLDADDFVTYDASASSTTLVAYLILTFIPMGIV